jgi:RHS repeat-associated protein
MQANHKGAGMSVVRSAMMKAALGSLAVCMGFCLIGLALTSPVAFAEGSSALGGTGRSLFESPLVAPEAQPLLGSQGVIEAEEARLASPQATVAREASQTKYEGLSPEAAEKVDGEVFPGIVDEPAGGLPKLPAGESVVGFSTPEAARVELSGGGHGVVESFTPMAVETSPGRLVAIDLGLSDAGESFEPRVPAAGLRIAKQLDGGVSLLDSGVSFTPVGNGGSPLSGEGVNDGASVFYANSQADTDTVVKPTSLGFEVSTLLRSANSPQQLSFRVGLPPGASLVQDSTEGLQVVDERAVLASVLTPSAVDAAGVSVPVSMSFSGDVLTLSVPRNAAEYEYPIDVDPSVVDKEIDVAPGNWVFATTNSKAFGYTPKSGKKQSDLQVEGTGSEYLSGQIAQWEYPTQGESDIPEFVATLTDFDHSNGYVESKMVLRRTNGEREEKQGGGYAEVTEPLTDEKTIEYKEVTVCGKDGCGGTSSSDATIASFEQEAVETGTGDFENKMASPAVTIGQSKAPTAAFDTTDATIEGEPNALLPGVWYNEKSALEIGLDARDYGIGIEKEGLSSTSKSGWGFSFKNESRNECNGVQCNECYEAPCQGKASGNGKPLSYALSAAEGGELPEGEDTIEGKVEDAVGLSATPTTAKIKIDNTPPSITSFSGLGNHELIDGHHDELKASAKSGPAGIASILLDFDGQPLSGPQGKCSGSCTGNAEWVLNGENYAAGEHTLTVIAEDNAHNVTKEEYHVTIHHPEGVAVGPGTVNPVTGELSLGATDVSVSVPDGALTVSRSYRSRHLAQGTEGPLGPQWSLALGAEQSLYRVSGGMILTGGSGGQLVFASKGNGEFTSPTGDAGLVLAEKTVEGKVIFTLSDDGSVTTFELPAGSSGSVWMPSSSEGPNGTSATLYKFKLTNGVIEPTEELAPVPAGVSCGKEVGELKEGCRALKFEYDEGQTTAKGEKATQWGEFKGHLSKVRYIAWNGSKTKEEPVVAEYSYDIQGRLRAVWNPQIKPELKTTYGYDTEGHVTAVSTAGHEPVLLEQGTIPGEVGPGRLLAVAAPSAGTALGSGEAPENKEVPTLSSTTPKVGVKISVNLTSEKTPGKWSAGPLAFIYQWEDCNSSGKECSPIAGAVNQAYYPVASDEGHELVAQVIALNATGATTASSAATSAVASGTPNTPLPEPPEVGSDAVTTLEYQVPVSGSGAPYELSSTKATEWGQSDDPSEAMAVFPPNKVMGWPAKEYKSETVYYLDGKDRTVNTAAPTGGISTAEYNTYNDVVRTLGPDNREAALKEGTKSAEASRSLSTESHYSGETKEEQEKEEKEVSEKHKPAVEPGTELLSVLGPQHTVKLAVGKEGKTNEEVLARDHTSYSYNEGAPSEGGPYHLVTKTVDGAETANKEEFDKRTTTTSYGGQEGLGWKLRKPTSVTTSPGGLNLVHTTLYETKTGNVIETRMPAAGKGSAPRYSSTFGKSGSGHGEFKFPIGIATNSNGDILVGDQISDRIQEFNSTREYVRQFGKSGTKEGEEFKEPEGIATNAAGDVYVVDSENNRVQEFSPEGKFIRMFGFGVSNGEAKAEVCTSSCHDGISGSGEGQFKTPTGITIDSSNDEWVTDAGNNRVEEFSETGTYLKKFGSEGTGESEFKHPTGITISGSNLYVVDEGNNRVEEFSTSSSDMELGHFGKSGSGNGEFSSPNWIATEPTSGNLYVVDWGNGRVEEFTSSGSFVATFGSKGSGEGQFEFPKGVAVDSYGDVYVVDRGNYDVEEWVPAATGNEGAHDTKTIYYSSAANSEYSTCGEHPALANLPCETTPAAQPGTSGLPELPVTKYTYNIWDEPETTTETVGSTTRTKTDAYDGAGRLKTAAISSTVGTTLPTVTDEYNKETGALEKQCANGGKPCTEGKPKTITSVYNKLGELESYNDAAETENKTTYEYTIDGGVKKVTGEKGTETYTYNATTNLPEELLNEYGSTNKLKFTATHDAEGNMLTESYPNGMTATYTYNQVGKPTGLVYKKTTNCTEEEKEKCKWFKDTVVPSIHGQWLEQNSTFSHQAYTYDNAGRLTQVQNTPAGKDCTTRIYAYDEDTNRRSLTTRESSTEKCATEGGKVQAHSYDTADRLTDPGIAYNTFGDITTLPANDAEEAGEHALTSTYYTDNQVASQTQSEQTIGYNLDPAGRTLETISTGKPNNYTILSHYTGPSNAPAWTINPVSGEWRRNITGISGSLVAIQNNGETPELQLTNLHGDIIAKAYLSETATALAAKADTSEYGVPTVSAPAKYAWLGASELPTELPSGVIAMGVRSYVPQVGRFLQPDPIPGGSANAYAYTFGDPVNSTDPSGEYAAVASTASLQAASHEAEANAARRAAEREAAARAAAEQAAREAAAAAAVAGPQYAGEEEYFEEYEEWYEEEGGYEYAAYHTAHGAKPEGSEEHHAEPAILVQPLGGEAAGESTTRLGSTIPLCTAGSERPCARDARGGEGTVYRGRRPRYSNVPSGNACVGLGTTAAYVSPFAPELAGVLIGVFLAARC